MKIAIRCNFRMSLDMLLMSSAPASPAPVGVLGQIKLSKDQWKRLCELYDEQERLVWQHWRAAGAPVLGILTRSSRINSSRNGTRHHEAHSTAFAGEV